LSKHKESGVAREVEKVEFAPEEPRAVVSFMERLLGAGDGWINLVPGLEDDQGELESTSTGLSSLFTSAQAQSTMCTWVPPKPRRDTLAEVDLGIMHPRGRRAVEQLRDAGIAVPAGWRVKQDHQRRGLLLKIPTTAPNLAVLDWAVRAGSALCNERLAGTWQAIVYLPRIRSAPSGVA
jgi:hypothetical protein